MAKYRVMFARFPGNHQEHPASSGWAVETALRIAQDFPDVEVVPWRLSDTPITMGRNRAVKQALQRGIDYLLMLDNDMEPDPKSADGSLLYAGAVPFWDAAWDFLMRHRDAPCAVAVPYCGPSPHHNIFAFRWATFVTGHPHVNWSLEQFTREEAALRAGVEEIAALATGLIVYDVRVFRDMKRPWFYYEWTDEEQSEKGSTEDVTQTRDMSLAWYVSGGKVGGRVYCAWDSWAHHIKLEHVPKPLLITADQVGASLKEAVLRGVNFGEKVRHFGPPPWARKALPPVVEVPRDDRI